MATSGVSSSSSSNRITGLATGLDTEQMVKDLIKVDKMPINKISQKKQLAEWRTDSYRNVTNLLRGVKDQFFDVLKPTSNMTSRSTYLKYSGTSSDSNVVTVSGNSESASGTHTIKVEKLASAGVATSNGKVTDSLTGTAVEAGYQYAGKKINLNINGVAKEITLGNYASGNDLATGVAALANAAFGAGKVTASFAGDKLTLDTNDGVGRLTLSAGSSNDGLQALGFTAGATNRISTADTLATLSTKLKTDLGFSPDNKLSFKINGTSFSFNSTDSLSKVISTVNASSTAMVNMQYDENRDRFVMTSKQLGAGTNISIEQTEGNLFATVNGLGGAVAGAVDINTNNSNYIAGDDAHAIIDGMNVYRQSNSFNVNGVNYNLVSAAPGETKTVTLTQDTETVFNNIKTFVEKYNELVDKLNKVLTDKYDRNFQPLSDDQKAEMEPEDIKKWEEKAKTGLLRNDPLVQNIVYNLRRSLSENITGISSNLASIGIKSGGWQDKGKLSIDETKLKDAIKASPETVADMFTKTSSVTDNINLTTAQKDTRFKEEGFANRILDVLNDNIRTARDSMGKKGILLEKAGVQGDLSEFTSTLFNEISKYSVSIKSMTDKLYEKEDNYYKKFAKLETYIQRMNQQSSYLTSRFSG